MALTLEAEQRMGRASLIVFYGQHEAMWRKAMQETYEFIK